MRCLHPWLSLLLLLLIQDVDEHIAEIEGLREEMDQMRKELTASQAEQASAQAAQAAAQAALVALQAENAQLKEQVIQSGLIWMHLSMKKLRRQAQLELCWLYPCVCRCKHPS